MDSSSSLNRSVSRRKKTHPRILAPAVTFRNLVLVMTSPLSPLTEGIAGLNLKLPTRKIERVVDKDRRWYKAPLKNTVHVISTITR